MIKNPFWRRFCRNKGAVIGLMVLLLVALLALAGPWLTANDPWSMVEQPFLAPFAMPGFAMGTDTLGRDILAGASMALGFRC
jgi:peptide/nickel transport system permease protein